MTAVKPRLFKLSMSESPEKLDIQLTLEKIGVRLLLATLKTVLLLKLVVEVEALVIAMAIRPMEDARDLILVTNSEDKDTGKMRMVGASTPNVEMEQ